jgi:hypothetical protein
LEAIVHGYGQGAGRYRKGNDLRGFKKLAPKNRRELGAKRSVRVACFSSLFLHQVPERFLSRGNSSKVAFCCRQIEGLALLVLGVYGMGRFPVTLYKEQWLKLLDMAPEIRAFIAENEPNLIDYVRASAGVA